MPSGIGALSLARRLGVDIGALAPIDRMSGVVEMVVDATANFSAPLSAKRPVRWHDRLFPTATEASRRIRWERGRTDAAVPCRLSRARILSARLYEALPPAQ